MENFQIYTTKRFFKDFPGYRVFEVNHDKNCELLGGNFDRFKVIDVIDDLSELTKYGSYVGQKTIIVEMVNPNKLNIKKGLA